MNEFIKLKEKYMATKQEIKDIMAGADIPELDSVVNAINNVTDQLTGTVTEALVNASVVVDLNEFKGKELSPANWANESYEDGILVSICSETGRRFEGTREEFNNKFK